MVRLLALMVVFLLGMAGSAHGQTDCVGTSSSCLGEPCGGGIDHGTVGAAWAAMAGNPGPICIADGGIHTWTIVLDNSDGLRSGVDIDFEDVVDPNYCPDPSRLESPPGRSSATRTPPARTTSRSGISR